MIQDFNCEKPRFATERPSWLKVSPAGCHQLYPLIRCNLRNSTRERVLDTFRRQGRIAGLASNAGQDVVRKLLVLPEDQRLTCSEATIQSSTLEQTGCEVERQWRVADICQLWQALQHGWMVGSKPPLPHVLPSTADHVCCR